MSLTGWMDSKIKTLTWYDMALVKLSVAAIILMIAKLWSPLLALDWYWYGLIFVVAAIKPMIKIFKKEAVVV